MTTRAATRVSRAAGMVLALAVLCAVFAAYLDPQLAFELATRAWACP
jgi:hypothetical protein